jgi:hypothetical protein
VKRAIASLGNSSPEQDGECFIIHKQSGVEDLITELMPLGCVLETLEIDYIISHRIQKIWRILVFMMNKN